MQIFCCVSNSGALFAWVIIQHTGTPASVPPIPTTANDTLTNVDGLVCNYGNSSYWNCVMTSTDTGPWTKNISRPAAMFCHCTPQRAIKRCRKQLLTQQGADALEDAPSKPGGFFIGRGQEIFWYRSSQQLPLIHLSQCPVNITLPVRALTSLAWPRRTFLLTLFSRLRC